MNKTTILVADNIGEYRKSLRGYLELENYQVEGAASVEETIEKLETVSLDLSLVDLRLTDDKNDYDISGLEVAKKAVEEGIPCIIITAFPSVEATRLALRSRGIEPPLAVDFVPKVDGPQAILEAIRRVPSLDHFVLLHISDLHFRSPGEKLPYDQGRSLRALKEDLKQLRVHQRTGRIQAIVVSGDISYKCQEQGFTEACAFLDELCRELRIPPEHVVLAPGNHDVNRSKAREEWESLPGDRRENDILFSKFEDYLNFTTHFYGEPAFTPRKLYKVFDFGRLAIVAFNSCYREGNPRHRCPTCDDEHYHGWLNAEQVSRARDELDNRCAGRETLRLAVCHHQTSPKRKPKRCNGDHLWNYDDRLKFELAEGRFRVLLHGHGHEAQLRQPPTPGAGMPYPFGSGTLLLATDRQRWENQYLILDLAPSGSRVIMRKYEPSRGNRLGDWTADNSIQIGGIVKLVDITLPSL
jgi:CheY-like chemotaxis protein